jgi:hypothetical protein
VKVTFKNQGTWVARGSFYMNLYLSKDSWINRKKDKLLGTRYLYLGGLAPGHSRKSSTTLTLPTILPPGTYYLGALADSINRFPEESETNNASAGNTVTIQ